MPMAVSVAMAARQTSRGGGGNGGLVVLGGNTNPTGNGSIDVIARSGGNHDLVLGGDSGTIVSPNPGILGNTQVYFQQGHLNSQLVSNRATQQTQTSELLTHNENLILLTQNGNNPSLNTNLFQRMLQSIACVLWMIQSALWVRHVVKLLIKIPMFQWGMSTVT